LRLRYDGAAAWSPTSAGRARSSRPLPEAVATLNSFQPDGLTGYPSVIARLAEQQLRGRLHISPSVVVTSSELQTPEVAARLHEAFGRRPYDVFASTEGLWGIDCEHHAGVHLFEDLTLVENVDEDRQAVPPGQAGARLLITSLVNRTQAIIRLELTDVIVLDDEPCPRSRTLVRARTIEGRRDDVIQLPGAGGQPVSVAPIEFGIVSPTRTSWSSRSCSTARAWMFGSCRATTLTERSSSASATGSDRVWPSWARATPRCTWNVWPASSETQAESCSWSWLIAPVETRLSPRGGRRRTGSPRSAAGARS